MRLEQLEYLHIKTQNFKIMETAKNKTLLTGHIGTDPQVKTFGDNKKLARVSIAVNERFKNHLGEWITDTQWHNLVFWGKQAEFAEQNLSTGTEIAIDGKLINRSYVSKDGATRYITEIVVHKIKVLPKESKA